VNNEHFFGEMFIVHCSIVIWRSGGHGITTPMSTSAISQEEALRSVYRMRRILEAARSLNSTLDLVELTEILLRIVRDEIGVDRGTLFVVHRQENALRSVVAQGASTEIAVPLGIGIAGLVAVSGEPVDIPDAYSDGRFNSSFDSVLGYRTRDIFCMPVINRSAVIVGVLELMNRSRPLTEEDFEFLDGISVHIGLAIENASMHREIVEKRRMEKEILLAREIQQHLRPNIPDRFGNVQISASSVMCDAVGGDYLDYFRLPGGRFIIALGDVSGKGIAAALVMSSLHAVCRALVRQVQPLNQIAESLNETLVDTTDARTYVTFLIMLVDPITAKIEFVRAGQNPPLIVGPGGNVKWLDAGGGPPAGMFPGTTYIPESIDFQPGTTVVLCTDGITDSENSAGELFGSERLASLVAAQNSLSASEIHGIIQQSVGDFAGQRNLSDDCTLVVLKF
jgi:sigma-B regulation protein RsbU (phosphoserine phosphatase)